MKLTPQSRRRKHDAETSTPETDSAPLTVAELLQRESQSEEKKATSHSGSGHEGSRAVSPLFDDAVESQKASTVNEDSFTDASKASTDSLPVIPEDSPQTDVDVSAVSEPVIDELPHEATQVKDSDLTADASSKDIDLTVDKDADLTADAPSKTVDKDADLTADAPSKTAVPASLVDEDDVTDEGEYDDYEEYGDEISSVVTVNSHLNGPLGALFFFFAVLALAAGITHIMSDNHRTADAAGIAQAVLIFLSMVILATKYKITTEIEHYRDVD